MTVNEFYRAVDGDYTDAVNRLQSDALLAKFLKMLFRDNSMEMLTEAMQAADAKKACLGGRGLRGSVGGLPQEAEQYYHAVHREYMRLRKALEELEG